MTNGVGSMLKFSVVTPSYNQAAFIAQTIESVLSQAGEFEIEYWAMDGGSTDGSVEIIRRYADRLAAGDWPVRCAGISMQWVSQRDKGQSDAINQGVRRSTGDILSYINSDDLYCPGAFERVAREFAARPDADFIYGDGDVIDAEGNLQWEWLSRPYDHKVMTSYHFLWNDFTNYIMQQATFWRRRVQARIGYFDESFHYAMDVEYWIRAGQARLRLCHVPLKLAKFRLIPGTKSLSNATVFWGDYLEIFRRYRGNHSLALFFAYYYYNLARQYDLGIEQAPTREAAVFARWESLPSGERGVIERQAEQGWALACLLLANEAHQQQSADKVAVIFRKGLTGRPLLALHPFAMLYCLKRALGPQIAAGLDRWGLFLIRQYRQRRYQYRYHPKK